MSAKEYYISRDKGKLNLELIHQFLKQSYWASDRSIEDVIKSIHNSICFGLYSRENQIGFARVISDKTTFAYIADLFILEKYRGIGLAKILLRNILSDEELNLSSWYLITKDAQKLYEKFGFTDFTSQNKTIMHKMQANN